ncbi:unnamed protein product [Peniophora sp. CBMAI 1063]|nr:unnamed protein product [Peniophora sp. CBMAI 1063]
MDTHVLVELLRDGPNEELIRTAGDAGQDPKGIVPLLDAELKRSASRLQRLKEYRNRLMSPMYRLEPELLSRIMFIYARDNDELYNLRWTRLIFVCRRWHDVATHALKLWSFIEVVAPDTVKSLTRAPQELYARDIGRVGSQRSRAAHSPLSVKMSAADADLYEGKTTFMSMFNWYPSSLSSLILTAKAGYVEPIARMLATHRHDILTNLKVRCGDCTVAELATLRLSFDVAFQDNLPQLSHLTIDITFDWALLRGLRTLRVLFSNYRDDRAALSLTFTLRDIVDALARCPLLEHLEIRLPHGFAHNATSAVFPVSLPYLDTAFIQAALSVCSEFLGALSGSPSTAKMSVNATSPSDDLSTLSRLSSFLSTHASNEGAPVIRSLVMARQSRLGALGAQRTSILTIIGRTSTTRLDGRTAMPLSSWSVERAYTTSSHIGFEAKIADSLTELQALTNTLRSWPLSQVTHLDLRSMSPAQNPLYIILDEVPAVTSVVVRPNSSAARELIEYLRSQLREYGRRVLARIAFDASSVRDTQAGDLAGLLANPLLPSTATARETVMRMLLYCREAATAGVAMDVIELYDEPKLNTRHRLMDPEEEIDWSELYSDLRYGFVYEGVLHSGNPEYDGRRWDSFKRDGDM